MSKTVDERVVEMRFDNSQFERNVQTSMSTLDKLKQKLNLSGAAKGLENINASAKRVDMSGLGAGVESVSAKFSALQVMGVTALANITNSAVNAGKKIVSALTLDPVKDGFAEYETQMNAVQTILANTQKEGTNVKMVNAALDELNTYADKTIYNFTEMTRNIGTFTAAGVKLNDSVNSIKGIANLAAISGSTSQQASTAMYQLSQAIAAGKVQLMDWNSVVNAGMGGQVFQDALIRTSELLKTGAKDAINTAGSFRESLTKSGWLTTEVLTQTLDQFATAAETQEEYEAAVKKFVDQGYTQEEAKQIADMARTAGEAATKVKTFSQLIDTLKEALGSGWTTTWRLIIGDFEEAKNLWTGVSDVLGGFINKMSDARNKLLESALGKGFSSLSEKISNIIEPAKKVSETINKTVDTISNLGGVVDDVILGKFGNGQERFNALTEAGVNWCKVQNEVNEKLGNSYRYTEEQIEAQDKLLGVQNKNIDGTKEESKETGKLTEEKKELIKRIASMTEEQMRAKGYTDEQIAAFKELGETADKLGIPLNEFIDNMDQITGRWLLINSFKNIGNSIVNVFKSIGKAWGEIFKPMSADKLFDIIAAFHKFTATIKTFTEENADNLTRTFKGLFAALDIVRRLVGGGLSIAFKAVSAILGAFDMNILDLTANIGDAIVKLRSFLLDNDLITKGFELMAKGVKMAVEALKDLYNTVKDLPAVQNILEKIKDIDLSEVGKNILEGLKNGLKDGITSIPDILIEIGKSILEAIKGVLGIHSPSTEMYAIGQYAIEGLVNGLKDGAGKVWDVISDIGSKMLEWIKNFDWDKAFAVGVSIALVGVVKKLADTVDNFTAPLKGLGSMLSGAGAVLTSVSDLIDKSARSIKKVIKSFSKILSAKAFQMKAEAIRNLAISIAILAGAVYLLAQLDYGKLWSSVGAIAALAAILVALSFAMDKLTSASASFGKDGFNLRGLKTGLVSIGVALLLIAATVKLMGSMDPDQAKQGFIGLAGLVIAIAGVFAAFGLFVKGKSAQNIDKAGKMLKKMAVTLLLLVAVVKLVGMLSKDEMIKGAAFAGAFLVFVTALNAASLLAGKNIDKIGGMVLKLSIAMALLVGVVKLVGGLSPDEMKKGAAFAGAFLIFVAALVAITKIGKTQQIAKLGGLLLAISTAMMLMVGVIKLVSLLKPGEMIKGAAFAAGFVLFVKALVAVTKIGSEEQIAKVAGTILAMSVAIGIMAGVCILLGLINLADLAKGVVAVSILGAMLALMIKSLKGANDVKGSIIAMAVAIGVMAVAVAALSFIDPAKLAGATTAMTILMGMFALIAKASSSLQGAMRSLIVMTVAVGLLAGVIALLSMIPIESAMGASASLSVLLLSLSASMMIISKAGMIAPTALVAIGIIAAVMAALAGILYLIRGMDPTSAIGNAAALSMLILSLSAACAILAVASLTAPTAIIAAGVMTLVVAALAGILYLIRDMDPTSAIGNAAALSVLLLSLSAACVILAGVGMLGPAAIIGVGSLLALVTAVSGLIIGIGALATYFPQMEEFLNRGLPILEQIGYGLGSFFGNIVAGFAEGVTSGLPAMATNLSDFMINLQPFISGAKQIDETALTGVKSLVSMVAAISAANILESIASWLTGSSSMATFATQIGSFGDAMVAFSNKVKGNIDESSVTAAINAGQMMTQMANAMPSSGGLFQLFSGEKNMAEFATQFAAFGDAIVSFSNTVSAGINEEAVTAAANAGKIMAEMQSSIEPTGGVVQWFSGQKNMATFGTQLAAFGEGIVQFSNSVSAGINEEAVTAAASAGKIMIAMQKDIVPSGGVVQWFTGQKNMATFGTQIAAFGKAMAEFSETVTGNISEEGVTAAANAGKMMATLQKSIPEKKWLDGKVTLDDFGKKIKKFGGYLVDYSDKVSDIDSGTVSSSITQAKRLASLARSVVDIDTDGIDNFKKVKEIGTAIKKYNNEVEDIDTGAVTKSVSAAIKLKSLLNSLSGVDPSGVSNFKVSSIGKSMKSYSDSVSGISTEAVSSSITSAKRLVALINSMAGIDTSGVGSFKKAMASLGTVSISSFVKSFSASVPKLASIGTKMVTSLVNGFKSRQSAMVSTANSMTTSTIKVITSKAPLFNNAGKMLSTRFVAGLSSQRPAVSRALSSSLSSCVSGIRGYYSNFFNAGTHLVSGFASGISSNSYKAVSKAKAMAEKAYKAAKDALGIHSPSRVFKILGKYVAEGFGKGITGMSSYIESSSISMARTAISGTEDALTRMADIINNDSDVQPTIRPVLDLSDIKSGAGSISQMFSNGASVGLKANVSAISTMMSRNRQNGSNDDVISAIDKLGKNINDISRPSYTIEGITYDNGSEIANAVETLISAARRERRV